MRKGYARLGLGEERTVLLVFGLFEMMRAGWDPEPVAALDFVRPAVS
jgi:hypothetical protein